MTEKQKMWTVDFIWPIQSKYGFRHLFTSTNDLKPNLRFSYPSVCCGAFSFIWQLTKLLSEWIVWKGQSIIVRPGWIKSFYYLVLNKINNTTRKGMQKWGKEPMFFVLHIFWSLWLLERCVCEAQVKCTQVRVLSSFQNDNLLPAGSISGANQHGYKIHRVDRFDAGRYTCRADNGVGSPATAQIDLQVLCKSTHILILVPKFAYPFVAWPKIITIILSRKDSTP